MIYSREVEEMCPVAQGVQRISPVSLMESAGVLRSRAHVSSL